MKFKLPDPEAGGLAIIVEGLGFGALFLALLSGFALYHGDLMYRGHMIL